jgi:hypothetical protein
MFSLSSPLPLLSLQVYMVYIYIYMCVYIEQQKEFNAKDIRERQKGEKEENGLCGCS